MALLQHEMKKEKTHRQVIEGGVLQVGPLRGRIGVVSTEPADEERQEQLYTRCFA